MGNFKYKYFFPNSETHSALKLEKKCNFKSTKAHFLLFQKWQKKIIFAQEKGLKLPKMQFWDFFLMQKLIFCHFWNSKKCIFVLLKLHFFLILEHCALPNPMQWWCRIICKSKQKWFLRDQISLCIEYWPFLSHLLYVDL